MTAATCHALLNDLLYNPYRYDLENCATVNVIRTSFYQALRDIDIWYPYPELGNNTILPFLTQHLRTSFDFIAADNHQYYGSLWFIIFCTLLQTNARALSQHSIDTDTLQALITTNYAPVLDLMLSVMKGGFITMQSEDIGLLYIQIASLNNAASAQFKHFVMERLMYDEVMLTTIKTHLTESLHPPSVIDHLICSIASNGADFAARLLIGLWQKYYFNDSHTDNNVNLTIQQLLARYCPAQWLIPDSIVRLLEHTITIVYDAVPHSQGLWRSYIIQEDCVEAFYDFLENVNGSVQECKSWLQAISSYLHSQVSSVLLTPQALSKLSNDINIYRTIIQYTNQSSDTTVLQHWLHLYPQDYLLILNYPQVGSLIVETLLSDTYYDTIAANKLAALNCKNLNLEQRDIICHLATPANVLAEYKTLQSSGQPYKTLILLYEFAAYALQKSVTTGNYEELQTLGTLLQDTVLLNPNIYTTYRKEMLAQCYVVLRNLMAQDYDIAPALNCWKFLPQQLSFYNHQIDEMFQPEVVLTTIIDELIATHATEAIAQLCDYIFHQKLYTALEQEDIIARLKTLAPDFYPDPSIQIITAKSILNNPAAISVGHTLFIECALIGGYTPEEISVLWQQGIITPNAEEWAVILEFAIEKRMDLHIQFFTNAIQSSGIEIPNPITESLLVYYLATNSMLQCDLSVIQSLVQNLGINIDCEIILEASCLNVTTDQQITSWLISQLLLKTYAQYDHYSIIEYLSDLCVCLFYNANQEQNHLPLLDAYFQQLQPYGDAPTIWNQALVKIITSKDYIAYEKLEGLSDYYAADIDFAILIDVINASANPIEQQLMCNTLYEAFPVAFIQAVSQYVNDHTSEQSQPLLQAVCAAMHGEIQQVLPALDYAGYPAELTELLLGVKTLPLEQQAMLLLTYRSTADTHSLLFELTHDNENAFTICNQIALIDEAFVTTAVNLMPSLSSSTQTFAELNPELVTLYQDYGSTGIIDYIDNYHDDLATQAELLEILYHPLGMQNSTAV